MATRRRSIRSSKEISVMAWIEDPFGYVLFVKQARGKRLWALPGGKVGPRESLLNALRREIKEETGLLIDIAAPVDLYDRPKKQTVTVLFRVLLKKSPIRARRNQEVEALAFRKTLSKNSTPSARYFWARAEKSFEPLALLDK